MEKERLERKKTFYETCLKRPIDFMCALAALIVLSPVFLVIAILVRINLGSPVIFKQERPGLNEKIFALYKFRTMNDKKDENGKLLPDTQRLTKFGKMLRNSSLDELPELFNILKGDMSIVGPRPLLVKYLPLYSERQRHRHDVRSGLTGLAQVNGRNTATWEQRFEYDLEYVSKITFWGDVRIVFDTFAKVLKHEGIDSETTKKYTVEEFTGIKEK